MIPAPEPIATALTAKMSPTERTAICWMLRRLQARYQGTATLTDAALALALAAYESNVRDLVDVPPAATGFYADHLERLLLRDATARRAAA